MSVIARSLKPEEIKELAEYFQAMDTSKTGYLSPTALWKVMVGKGYDVVEEEIMSIINEIDYSHSGKINYTEFLTATL